MKTYSIPDLNAYESDRCLRRYQKLIADGQPFAVSSEGSTYTFQRCFALSYANLLVLTSSEGNAHLLGDGAANGYQLADCVYGNAQPVNDLLLRPYSRIQPCIVMGHHNFAHFIWNHLPAFDVIARDTPRTYCQLFDSFGKSHKILGFSATEVSKEQLSDFKSTLYVGGEYLNAETSTRLTTFLADKMLGVDSPPELSSSDIIYIGVRGTTTRELTNEVEFYVELLLKLSQINPRCFFYLDGYSYDNSNQRCEKSMSRIRVADESIKHIVASWGGSRYRIINGLHLMEALSFIRHISFYITHEGTMQHKIGWLYPQKKGVILSGSSYQRACCEWHAAQVDGAQIPHHLKDDHVVPHKDEKRVSSFSIRDIKGSGDHIALLLTEVLSG